MKEAPWAAGKLHKDKARTPAKMDMHESIAASWAAHMEAAAKRAEAGAPMLAPISSSALEGIRHRIMTNEKERQQTTDKLKTSALLWYTEGGQEGKGPRTDKISLAGQDIKMWENYAKEDPATFAQVLESYVAAFEKEHRIHIGAAHTPNTGGRA